MRIRYKLLIIVAASVLLTMSVSILVTALVVRRQNDFEAWARIDTALDAVADELDTQANRLSLTMRDLLRGSTLYGALRALVWHDAKPGADVEILSTGERLVEETHRLVRNAGLDRLEFHYPDGRMLFELTLSDGDTVASYFVRSPEGEPAFFQKHCRPREDCRDVPWERQPLQSWPVVERSRSPGQGYFVEIGSMVGLELAGFAAQGLGGDRYTDKDAIPYRVAHFLDLDFHLRMSDRTNTDIGTFTARHARWMPMWNAPELTGEFIDALPLGGVQRLLKSGDESFYAAFRPLADAGGQVVGVASARMSTAGTTQKTREAIIYLVVVAAGSVVLMVPVALLLSHRFVRPIHRLRHGVVDFAEGDLSNRVSVSNDDEIGDLATAFNQMAGTIEADRSKLQALNEQLERYNLDLEEKVRQATKSLVLKNQQMQHDLNIAAEFQNAILPSVPPTTFLQCAIRYMPYGGGVSGDVYDISLNTEGAVNVFLGDATGHGVAAAIMTMMAQIGLDSVGGDLSTVEIIRRLNELFAARERDMSITAVFLRITPSGKLLVTNAGHPATLVVPQAGAEVLELKGSGVPLGMFQEELIAYEEVAYTLQDGDRVLTYTDGLTEWAGGNGEQYGLERLKRVLLETRQSQVADLPQRILEDVRSFAGERPCDDDLTMLAFDFVPAPGRTS